MTEVFRDGGGPWLPPSGTESGRNRRPPLPVLLVAAHPIVRSGLARILHGRSDLELVADTDGVKGARSLLAAVQPRVVLFAPEDGSDEIGELIALSVQAEVPVLLVYGPDAAGSPELDVPGVLHANATPEQISAALHAVAVGLNVTGARQPRRSSAPQESGAADLPLTDREMQVLQLVAGGLPNKGIARRLNISEHTVKFHVGSILGKLGAASRTEAVTVAAHRGLLTL